MDTLPPVRSLWVVILVLLGLGMLLACAERSTANVSESRLKRLVDDENKKAKRLSDFLDESYSVFRTSVQFFYAFILLAIGMCAMFVYIGSLFGFFRQYMPVVPAFIASYIIIAVVTALVYLVAAYFLPKGIAGKYPEKTALALLSISEFITAIGKPFVFLPDRLAKIILKIFGINPDEDDEDVTEEEIRMMVDIGSESGAIDDDEKEMIHNIFELDDKPVEDIMTHRTDAVILWINDGPDKWEEIINETNHTRYPVCGNAIDDIIGVLNSRDFYKFLLKNRNDDLRSILRKPYFVPESIKADEMFSQMQDKNAHFAIVLDEYGGFRGIVTQEDLIEEIVGELYSEYDEPEQDKVIYKLPGDEEKWFVDGSAEIDDVAEELGIDIPSDDYNTFAGLVLDELGTVPADGETPELVFGRMQIKVTKVFEHRIEETVVTLLEEETDGDGESDDKDETSGE